MELVTIMPEGTQTNIKPVVKYGSETWTLDKKKR
jgi:hypothetical protein